MGSTIELESEVDQGSKFKFSLECNVENDWIQANISTNLGKLIGYSGNPKTILVVDDRWENRSVIYNLLQPLGFEVKQASNGKEGIEQIQHKLPDLIITDLKMPVMDGWELLAKISSIQMYQNIKVIVSSASVFEEDRHQSFSAGADDFLPKPVEADTLYLMLAKHLNLDWQYEHQEVGDKTPDSTLNQTSSHNITIPNQEQLQLLLERSMEGNISEIRNILTNLSAGNREYQIFVDKILHFVDNFQIKELRQYLQSLSNNE